MKPKENNFSNFIEFSSKNNRIKQNSNNINEDNSGKEIIIIDKNNSSKIDLNKPENNNFLNGNYSNNGDISPIKIKKPVNNKIKSNNHKEDIINENNINSEDFINVNSFMQGDIEEIKNIFEHDGLQISSINSKIKEPSILLENSEEDKTTKKEISLKDLDPKIRDVTILFVLSSNYYELLVQERAKKAFNFNKKKI